MDVRLLSQSDNSFKPDLLRNVVVIFELFEILHRLRMCTSYVLVDLTGRGFTDIGNLHSWAPRRMFT